jgi:hypothetical protein
MKIEKLLARRTDLSTFLVHLCRDGDGHTAKDRLARILTDGSIKARTAMGQAVNALRDKKLSAKSQRCVCFTETPLEHVSLLLGDIEGRACHFEPYGIAITKKQGRANGVNPVWYVDITPGHDWLTNPLNDLIAEAIDSGDFAKSAIAKITPFIEQMGSGTTATGAPYRKEFWWEREWRCVGDFVLPTHLIVLCPESERKEFKKLVEADEFAPKAKFVDPRWSLEQIIARLAGFGGGR